MTWTEKNSSVAAHHSFEKSYMCKKTSHPLSSMVLDVQHVPLCPIYRPRLTIVLPAVAEAGGGKSHAAWSTAAWTTWTALTRVNTEEKRKGRRREEMCGAWGEQHSWSSVWWAKGDDFRLGERRLLKASKVKWTNKSSEQRRLFISSH